MPDFQPSLRCPTCLRLEALVKNAHAALDVEDLENPVFEELVSFALTHEDHEFYHLDGDLIQRVRQVFFQHTFALENAWSHRLLRSESMTFKDYPQYPIYTQLCEHLHQKIQQHAPLANLFLFVGGGPLPSTALILANEKGYKGHIIDSHSQACTCSGCLIKKLGIKNLSVETACGCHFGYEHFPIIILAAQAGLDEKTKDLIIARIEKTARPNTLILLRSSKGVRRLLYPEVRRTNFGSLKVIEEESPEKDTLSHLVILRKSEYGHQKLAC
jgi:hypothetical protein